MRCVVFELAGGGTYVPPPAVRRWLRPPAVRGLSCVLAPLAMSFSISSTPASLLVNFPHHGNTPPYIPFIKLVTPPTLPTFDPFLSCLRSPNWLRKLSSVSFTPTCPKITSSLHLNTVSAPTYPLKPHSLLYQITFLPPLTVRNSLCFASSTCPNALT